MPNKYEVGQLVRIITREEYQKTTGKKCSENSALGYFGGCLARIVGGGNSRYGIRLEDEVIPDPEVGEASDYLWPDYMLLDAELNDDLDSGEFENILFGA